MTKRLQPIKVWGAAGPNPPKVAFILEELDIPYEVVAWPITDVKKPEYLAINPNGRLPSIQDPNTNLTLWESGAIVEYLVEQYDVDNKLSFVRGSPESYLTKQWLFFQCSGQGPYYGQAAWFTKFHHERIPSATERYVKEVNRVSGVLDSYLKEQQARYKTDTPWLVANKMTYADLAFVQYQIIMGTLLSKDDYDAEKYPTMNEWIKRMAARPAVKKVLENASRASH